MLENIFSKQKYIKFINITDYLKEQTLYLSRYLFKEQLPLKITVNSPLNSQTNSYNIKIKHLKEFRAKYLIEFTNNSIAVYS